MICYLLFGTCYFNKTEINLFIIQDNLSYHSRGVKNSEI
jgi:hypothetical protein